ncbi:MAG: thioredoxin [Alphaproteobacteria bacterium]
MNTLDLGNGSGVSNSAAQTFVSETTTQNFARDVLDESAKQPVLVDFWAPWCGPCKTLTPIIEKVVNASGGAVRLVKLNIDDHPEIAGQMGIQSIPAVIAFKEGRPVDGFMGAVPESQVKAFIEKVGGPVGPSEADQLIESAEAMLEAGNHADAGRQFAAVLATTPDSVPAILGIARVHIATGNTAAAEETMAALPESAADDPAVAAVRAQLNLSEQSAALGDTDELRRRVADNPADLEARFDLAIALNAEDQREAAAEQLLDIIAANRSWQEEKARKQLLEFFEAWGPTEEATLAGRRRLSSLLFA